MTDTSETPRVVARIADRKGHGISGRIYWETDVLDSEISYAEAQEAQTRAGYSPLGYSFFGFSCHKVEGGFKATWSCAASCD